MSYESFPIQTKFRDELIEKLGYITLAEKHLPEVLTEGLYDKTLDRLREVTEKGGRMMLEGLEIEVQLTKEES